MKIKIFAALLIGALITSSNLVYAYPIQHLSYKIYSKQDNEIPITYATYIRNFTFDTYIINASLNFDHTVRKRMGMYGGMGQLKLEFENLSDDRQICLDIVKEDDGKNVYNKCLPKGVTKSYITIKDDGVIVTPL